MKTNGHTNLILTPFFPLLAFFINISIIVNVAENAQKANATAFEKIGSGKTELSPVINAVIVLMVDKTFANVFACFLVK